MRAAMKWILALEFFLCLTTGYADEFPFEPPKNFTLSPHYIGLHHPVKTNQITAQLYFDQGLTFIYAFNHDAAYWSFLKAAQNDPNMPMAYWGVALALGSNINFSTTPERAKLAYESIQKALRLSATGPENERHYIKALAQRYSNDPNADTKQLAINYSRAMGEVTKKYPDDLDAAVLYAESILDLDPWKQWTLDGKPREGTDDAAQALESVLLRDPQHLGANHYYVHTMEASSTPARALMSAERLKTLLPSSGHILHMPSHIYILVGDYYEAAIANEKAVAADREYIRQYGVGGIYPVHYLSHNLHFLAEAYAHLGNYGYAKRVSEELYAFYAPHFQQMPGMEEYAVTNLFIYLLFHKWQEILALPKPQNDMQINNAIWHFGRAMALANLGNMSQALEEKNLFLKAKDEITTKELFGLNTPEKILSIAQNVMEAKLAQVQGQNPAAIDFFRRAVAIQDTLSYDEPPNWPFSSRVSLGGVLLKDRQYEEAEQVFRENLKKHPRNGRSLFGLKESLAAQSKTDDYYWINKAFQQAWMYSDTNLTIDDL